MKRYNLPIIGCILFFCLAFSSLKAQNANFTTDGRTNVINSAVPFLRIAPDSRGGALGDASIAASPDANATFWNPSKLAFVDHEVGGSVSYVPWLRQIVPDMSLSYLSFYNRIDNLSAFAFSLRYFSLGDVQFTDQFGTDLLNFTPNEFAIDGTYARKLSDQFSIGVSFRFIHSNLSGSTPLEGGQETSPGNAVAGDLSAYYETNTFQTGNLNSKLSFGANISNIGSKITYTDEANRDFIPINLGIGVAYSIQIDDYNEFTILYDANKLLVPTPPIYDAEQTDEDGNFLITSGRDPDVPVFTGMIQSFYDAPGGLSEELNSIMHSVGLEYVYDKQFALRTGMFYEHPTKGNRQFVTAGLGVKFSVAAIDFSYLFAINSPTAVETSPLQNTLRFTLSANINELGKK